MPKEPVLVNVGVEEFITIKEDGSILFPATPIIVARFSDGTARKLAGIEIGMTLSEFNEVNR
jgi:hypothetical protein